MSLPPSDPSSNQQLAATNYSAGPVNPLLLPVLRCLKRQTAALGVHELMVAVQAELDAALEALPGVTDSWQLALFQKNFLLMNALFQWQEKLRMEGVQLSVSALYIALGPLPMGAGQQLTATPEQGEDPLALAQYYMDWNNFEATSAQQVDDLLAGFWQGYLSSAYLSPEVQRDACHCLGLSVDADEAAIKRRYRDLAAQHHPDRGGSAEQFIAIREAYEILIKARGSVAGEQ